jgi:hypothetical protein
MRKKLFVQRVEGKEIKSSGAIQRIASESLAKVGVNVWTLFDRVP